MVLKKRDARPEDLYSLYFPDSPAISPDGKQVAFAVRGCDKATDNFSGSIQIASKDGKKPLRVFTNAGFAQSPKWSPDEQSLAYL